MRTAIILSHLLLCVACSAADYLEVEFSTSGGYTGNLLRDSTSLEDNYTTNILVSNLYLAGGALISVTAEHTYYVFNDGLSNFLLKGGMTVIPTDDSSNWTVYWSANRGKRRFQEEDTVVSTSDVESTDYDLLTSVGYRISASATVRIGHSFFSTVYGNSQVKNNNRNEWFIGANLTLPGSNSLDVEAGYTTGRYFFAPEGRPFGDTVLPYPIEPDSEYVVLTGGDLRSIYISPRLAGRVGKATGLSVTYSYRKFIDRNDSAVVYGHSTGIISPWAASYEGSAFSIAVKTYYFSGIIVTAGAGYWDKTYLKTLERHLDPLSGKPSPLLSTSFSNPRQDYQRRLFLGVQFPMASRSSRVIEPSVRIDYTSNSSSIEVYDYTDFSISTGVRIKF